MPEIDIAALAATIPTWKVCQRFYSDVPVTSTQDHPDAPEQIHWPNGFDAPTEEQILAHKVALAEELVATQYRQDRAAAFAQRPLGDQLDAIIKGLKAAQAAGVELPPDTAHLIAWSDGIKAAHPKPPTAEPSSSELPAKPAETANG
jgi:hypothetical protein